MGSETINKKTQEILNDLSLLRKKHIHELDRSPGHAKCSTLADRMEENLECIISSFEEMLALKETAAEREKFDLLSGLLDGLAKEVSDLTKKQPDGLVNSFKVGQINRVLQPLKNLMISEPSNSFLDLVAEVEEQRRAYGVVFRLGRQHSLRAVASTARLSAPDTPPS